MREAVAPDWLVDIVRPKPVTVPWPLMIRAGLAICVPLTAGLLAHDLAPGLLAAMGGLIAVIVDVGGPYPARSGACRPSSPKLSDARRPGP